MVLARCEFDATDEAGNLLTNVTVEVRYESGGLASVYSDRAGTMALGNPFVCADGKVGFHTKGGALKITLTAGAYSRVRRYVALGLAAETDFTLSYPRGAYSAVVTYATGDLVYSAGGLFISRIDANLNHTPDSSTPGDTTQWMYAGEAVPGPAGPAIDPGDTITEVAAFTFDPDLHLYGMVRLDVDAEVDVTLPADAEVGAGFQLVQVGDGAGHFVAGSGATLNNELDNSRTFQRWSTVVVYVESNVGGSAASWVLAGSTSA